MFSKLVILGVLALNCVYAQTSSTTPVPILKQINRVNDDGSYTFGYEAADGTFKVETRDQLGNVKGKYGYIDETGLLKEVEYSAGNGTGFSATGNHLPESVPVAALPVAPAPLPQAPPKVQAPVRKQQPQQAVPQAVPQQFTQQQQFAPQPLPVQQTQAQFNPQQFTPQQFNPQQFNPQQFDQQQFAFQQHRFTSQPQQFPQQFAAQNGFNLPSNSLSNDAIDTDGDGIPDTLRRTGVAPAATSFTGFPQQTFQQQPQQVFQQSQQQPQQNQQPRQGFSFSFTAPVNAPQPQQQFFPQQFPQQFQQFNPAVPQQQNFF